MTQYSVSTHNLWTIQRTNKSQIWTKNIAGEKCIVFWIFFFVILVDEIEKWWTEPLNCIHFFCKAKWRTEVSCSYLIALKKTTQVEWSFSFSWCSSIRYTILIQVLKKNLPADFQFHFSTKKKCIEVTQKKTIFNQKRNVWKLEQRRKSCT